MGLATKITFLAIGTLLIVTALSLLCMNERRNIKNSMFFSQARDSVTTLSDPERFTTDDSNDEKAFIHCSGML